ncbi:TIGR02757 family protein [Geothrix sp. PMB-07]|uniref:TIGR02757 family protein n=1 Tax=Geothrix sp. PMB-07 TaxID=3068640 RepID=UPI0027413F5B|nr:TIGR02757 family protein [Geothrix sp. PMB-07]WLT29960.1 TIGR02757 family protein [Geothrix sp. PMB-07]
MGTPIKTLKARLDSLCDRYDTGGALDRDPLSVVLAYEAPMDREVAAFVAAHLAYGRVEPMIRAVQSALAPLGPDPAAWLRAQSERDIQKKLDHALKDWAWRFHTGPDLAAWLLAWKRLDAESAQGLEPHLLPQPKKGADESLSQLVQRLRLELPPTYGARFSLPDPLEGAACKRWRMFLRWMARPGWPDLGLWAHYPVGSLIIPLDTHVARVSRFIGLSDRSTPDGKMALEITASLRRLDSEDPLRYDFALSHLGILGDCPGLRHRSTCADCPLYTVCSAGAKPRKRK